MKKTSLNKQYEKYMPWRQAALQRDGNMCVDCGITNKIVVHHIDDCRKTGKLNNNLSNLVTVCKKCHARRHGYMKDSNEKVKKILKMRRLNISMAKIGLKMGMTRQRVYQLIKKYAPDYLIKVNIFPSVSPSASK